MLYVFMSWEFVGQQLFGLFIPAVLAATHTGRSVCSNFVSLLHILLAERVYWVYVPKSL